ncbi:DUF4232 domain-containing protein [Nocardioides sp. Bht2]|uniref:DUF4232 domain-containing protein n=1 Tax=Nocardioides sp. Bht2 TaxID=3392297 RepID=UPI0039B554D4
MRTSGSTAGWRRVGAAAGVLVIAGLLMPVTAAPQAGAAAPPSCTAGMTKVSFRALDGAAGSVYGRMRVRNVSNHTCTIRGYGGISYVGYGNGTQIGAPSQREPAVVRTVTLRPQQVAKARVRMVEAGNYGVRRCRPTAVDGFRVYLPGETRSQFARYTTTGCRNPNVHLLYSRPYRG